MSEATNTLVATIDGPATRERPGPWPNPRRGSDMDKGTCSFEGCSKPHSPRHAICKAHRAQQLKGQELHPLRPFGTPRERFWAKVDRRSSGECWEWQGARLPKGYGRLRLRVGAEETTHRLSWQFHYGPIPADMHVLHRCDNPPCVNPAHLWLGTNADNQRDMDAKGRRSRNTGLRGEDNPGAKLTSSQVEEIRRRYAQGETQTSLGARFGVDKTNIGHIVNRKSWT